MWAKTLIKVYYLLILTFGEPVPCFESKLTKSPTFT